MNIINKVVTVVKPIGSKVVQFCCNNSETIFTGLAISGNIVGTYLTAKNSIIAKDILDQLNETETSTMDKAKAVAPYVLPILASNALTITSIILLRKETSRKLSAAISACSAAVQLSDDLQAKLSAIPEKQMDSINDTAIDKKLMDNPLSNSTEIIKTGDGTVLCFDAPSGRYFWSDPSFLKEKLVDFQGKINNDPFGELLLNQFYNDIHLDNIPLANYAGWDASSSHKLNYRFKSKLTNNNIPVFVIDYDFYCLFDTRRW